MIGATLSEPLTTNIGSPQGAILSPTIFLILVADIGLWSSLTIHTYADDTTATAAGKNIEDLVNTCEEEAQKILDFMSVNKLKANDDKTHILVTRKDKKQRT